MKALPFLLAVILSVSAVYGQEQFSFRETYNVSLPAHLSIMTSDGYVDVKQTVGRVIKVFYIVRQKCKLLKIDRNALEKELKLEIIHDANNLRITVKYPEDYFRGFSMNRMQVGFEIHTPRETVCDLNTSDGNIELDGLNGNQNVKTSDGNIRITNVKGDVLGKTSDGDIHADKVTGALRVATSDGNIVLTGIVGDIESSTSDGNISLADVQGSASSKTSDGHIDFKDLNGSFTGSTSDGNINGSFSELKGNLTARTSDGNIDITIPGKMGLDLDIKAESMDVPLENFSGRSDKKAIQGKSNGGGIPVKLSSSDGRVSLAARN
jgi:hypothetical protein